MGILDKLFCKKESANSAVINKTAQKSPNYNTSSSAAAVPPLQGDYAKAIFLNVCSRATPIKKDEEYPRYFLYECGIRKPSAYHRELIREGYLVESDLKTMLSSMKVTELKDILLQMGESTTGKKDALIQRILDNGNEPIARQRFQQKTYMLSDKGAAFLKEHEDYMKIHHHHTWGIDWQTYDKIHQPGRSFNDTMWGVFNERLGYCKDFGRNEYLNMAQLLIEEGKRLDTLEMLLRILYIDISGVEGIEYLKLYKQGLFSKKDLKEGFSANIMLAPWVCGKIADYKDVYTDEVASRICEWKLPVQVCSKQLYLQIVHSIMDGSYDSESTKSTLKKSYLAYVDALH